VRGAQLHCTPRVQNLAPPLSHVAAGFRRALAMRTYQKDLGFTEILARRVRLEDADIARLVESFERENPSTFETCKYLFELREGIRGPGLRVADLAGATGKSVRHIDNLIRFYRVMPERLRAIWTADAEQRFTFAVLRELGMAAQANDGKAIEEILRRVGLPAKPGTGERSPPPPTPRPGVIRRLGYSSTAKLQRRLETAGAERSVSSGNPAHYASSRPPAPAQLCTPRVPTRDQPPEQLGQAPRPAGKVRPVIAEALR